MGTQDGHSEALHKTTPKKPSLQAVWTENPQTAITKLVTRPEERTPTRTTPDRHKSRALPESAPDL